MCLEHYSCVLEETPGAFSPRGFFCFFDGVTPVSFCFPREQRFIEAICSPQGAMTEDISVYEGCTPLDYSKVDR